MTVDTYVRIFVLILVGGWMTFTLPSLITGRWRDGDQRVAWPRLPQQRRADIIRTGGAVLIFGLGALVVRDRDLGLVPGLALVLPGVVTALCFGRIDWGNTHLPRRERPAPYWTMVVLGTFVSAVLIAILIRQRGS